MDFMAFSLESMGKAKKFPFADGNNIKYQPCWMENLRVSNNFYPKLLFVQQ